MFNPSNETHFSLTLEDFTGDLQVLSFTGTEGISQPYRFDVHRRHQPTLSLRRRTGQRKSRHRPGKNSCTSGHSWPSTHKATAYTARSTVSPKAMPASA